MSNLVEFAAAHKDQLSDVVGRPICELDLVVRCAFFLCCDSHYPHETAVFAAQRPRQLDNSSPAENARGALQRKPACKRPRPRVPTSRRRTGRPSACR